MEQLAGLPESARKLALERFQMLRPHLEEKRSLRLVAAEADIPFRTAQRWVAQYQRFGLAALTRRKPMVNGERRAVSEAIRKAVEGLALQTPPLPIAALYRQAQQLAEKLGEHPPSYWLVYRIVRELPADLVTLAHKGTKIYSDTFELVHRREAARSNAIRQADHTPLDILLVQADGEFAKPWLTLVIDDYSRAIAGPRGSPKSGQ